MSARETVRSTTLCAMAAAFWLAGAASPALAAGTPVATTFDSSERVAIPEVTVAARAPQAGRGAGFIDSASLKQYAMSDHQLGNVRGGFFLPQGVGLNFGFQQLTSVNGTVVQGILVPTTAVTSSETPFPVYVTGPAVSLSNIEATKGASATGGSSLTPSDSASCCSRGTSVSFNVTNGKVSSTLAPSGNPTVTLQGSSPALTISSDANGGQTAIQTVLGGNGLFSSISNSANNQVIQQATTLNLNVTGLNSFVLSSAQMNSLLQHVTQGTVVH
jgi:hypothetical protein